MSRGRKSTIRRLPPEILTELHRRLDGGTLTYDELLAWLKGEGADVSRSALHRYGAKFDQVAKAMREKREVAQALARELGAEADISPILIEQLHTILFRLQNEALSAEGDEGGIAIKDIRALATTIRQLSLASRDQVRLRAEVREELARAAEKAARKVIEGQSGEARRGGAEVLEKIREAYGIR